MSDLNFLWGSGKAPTPAASGPPSRGDAPLAFLFDHRLLLGTDEEYVEQSKKAGVSVGRSEEEQAGILRQRGYSEDAVRSLLGDYRLAQAQQRYKGTSPGGTAAQFYRNVMPLSSVLGLDEEFGSVSASDYQEAQRRFAAGDASPEVVDRIARFERLAERDQEVGSTFEGQILTAGQNVLKFVSEGWAAGKVLGLAGRIPGSGAAGRIAAGTQATRLSGQAARAGMLLPLMPSMYLDEMRSRNLEAGRDVNDLAGLPGPALLGYANLMVLNRIQNRLLGPKARTKAELRAERATRLSGGGLPAGVQGAGTIAAAGVLGTAEQQIVDAAGGLWDEVAPELWQTRTKYGTLGMLAEGKHGEAAQHVAVQAFTFSLFSGLHYRSPRKARYEAVKAAREVRDHFNRLAAEGLSARRAAEAEQARLEEATRVEVDKREAGLRLTEPAGPPVVTRGGELPPGLTEPAAPPRPPDAGLGMAEPSGGVRVTEGGELPPGLSDPVTGRSPPADVDPGMAPAKGQPVVTRGERGPEDGPDASPVPKTPPETPPGTPEGGRPSEGTPGASEPTGKVEAPPQGGDRPVTPAARPERGEAELADRRKRAEERLARMRLEKAFEEGKLSPAERAVMRDYAAGKTQKQIGEERGVEQQRVSQIAQKALKKLGSTDTPVEFFRKFLKGDAGDRPAAEEVGVAKDPVTGRTVESKRRTSAGIQTARKLFQEIDRRAAEYGPDATESQRKELDGLRAKALQYLAKNPLALNDRIDRLTEELLEDGTTPDRAAAIKAELETLLKLARDTGATDFLATKGDSADFKVKQDAARNLSFEAVEASSEIRQKWGFGGVSSGLANGQILAGAVRGDHAHVAKLHGRSLNIMRAQRTILQKFPKENADRIAELDAAIALHERAAEAHAEAALADPKNAGKIAEATEQDFRTDSVTPEDFYASRGKAKGSGDRPVTTLPPTSDARLAKLEDTAHLAPGVTPEMAVEYKIAFRRAFAELNGDVADMIAANVAGLRYYPDARSLTEAVLRDAIAAHRESGDAAGVARHEATLARVLAGRGSLDAAVWFNGHLYLDGETTVATYGGRYGSPASGASKKSIYLHELGHALDGRRLGISHTAGWLDAWVSDIKTPRLDERGMMVASRLTDYARTNPAEGFAEFFRVAHEADAAGLRQLAREFPKATAFFKSLGERIGREFPEFAEFLAGASAWPARPAARPVARAEVFNDRISLSGREHVDLRTGDRPVTGEEPASLPAGGPERYAAFNKTRDVRDLELPDGPDGRSVSSIPGLPGYNLAGRTHRAFEAAERGRHAEAADHHTKAAEKYDEALADVRRYFGGDPRYAEAVAKAEEVWPKMAAAHREAAEAHAGAALARPSRKLRERVRDATEQDFRTDSAIPEDFYSTKVPQAEPRLTDVADLHARGAGLKQAVGAWFRRWFLPERNAPREVFEILLDKDRTVAEGALAVSQAANDYIQAVGGKLWEVPEETVALHRRALQDPAVMATLPVEVRLPLTRFRNDVDVLSDKLLAAGVIPERLEAVIDAHKGLYLHRHYQAHTDPRWGGRDGKLYREHPEVVTAFKNWYNAEARRLGRDTLTDAELDVYIERLLADMKPADNPLTHFQKAGFGKDLGILMPRGDLAAPLRDLMGEVKHPVANYAATVGRQIQLLANHVAQKQLLEAGLAAGWLARPDDLSRPGLTARIAAPESGTMDVLAGMRTTPEVKEAIESHYARPHTDRLLKEYMKVLGVMKYGKTVLSPVAHMRQILGNPFFVLRNGYGFRKDAFDGLKAIWKGTPEGRALHQKLVRYGLDENSVFGKEFGQILNESIGATSPFDFAAAVTGRSLRQKAADLLRKPQQAYRYEDLVPKVFGWYAEMARMREAYPEWTAEQVEAEAARRVIAKYPSYSQLGPLVQAVKRFPVVGPFVSFTAEVIRTTYNTAKIAVADLNSGNPVLRKHGMNQLLGLTGSLAAFAAVGAVTRLLAGVSLEEEDAIRRNLPPWSRDGQLLHLGRGKDGKIRVIDLGRTDPHSYLLEPVQAAISGRRSGTWTPADSLMPLANPFVQEELGTRAALDVARNRQETGSGQGRPVYNPEDGRFYQARDIAFHFGKAASPGVLDVAGRLGMAMSGVRNPRTGREYSAGEEFLAAAGGQRVIAVDPAESLTYKARTYSGRISDASRVLSAEVNRQRRQGLAPSPESVAPAYARTEDMRSRIYDDLLADVRAARLLGLSTAEVAKALKAAGLSADDIGMVLGGKYKPRPVGESLKRR